jgi:hypothetical protein
VLYSRSRLALLRSLFRRGVAPKAHVVIVSNLVDLSRITQRGLAPSLPPGSRVQLALLQGSEPERPDWEHALSHHAAACGCEWAAVALALVMAALIAVDIAVDVTIALPGLPVVASWAVIGAFTVLVAKATALYLARRSLNHLHAKIATATAGTRTAS